jgi:poly(hydroxyalkanoate) depolymerase family esterase
MRGISDTIARLNAAAARAGLPGQAAPSRLQPLVGFGSNPGALNAHVYVPEALASGAALVVVLHGCTQTAAGYDTASGWSRLADEQGFALLYPEQQRGNNPNGCFNWFEPGDTRRGSGEAESIRQMIEAVRRQHAIDPRRIFITGLSAGGAMTATMLATYPEVFAGGAIIAGLPYGVARDMMQAFDRMRAHGLPAQDTLAAAVTGASSHRGPWPTVQVWHGDADGTSTSATPMPALRNGWAYMACRVSRRGWITSVRCGIVAGSAETARCWSRTSSFPAWRMARRSGRLVPTPMEQPHRSCWMLVSPPPCASRNPGASPRWRDRRCARRVPRFANPSHCRRVPGHAGPPRGRRSLMRRDPPRASAR